MRKSVERNHCDALLLSGGLDSSILAHILRPKQTFTVAWNNQAPDLHYARMVAHKYNTRHTELTLNNTNNVFQILRAVILGLKTFSPIAVRNSCVAYAGILNAKKHGFSEIMTGDGGDELFAGYNYLNRYFMDVDMLEIELRRLWDIMQFSSISLAKSLNIEVKTPFLDVEFLYYAKSISPAKKIGAFSGKMWGKFILRKCFLGALGEQIVWRPKLAQQEGAATNNLRHFLDTQFNESAFRSRAEQARAEGVIVKDKEHLYYYDVFRSYFCPPYKEDCSDARCPECGGCVSAKTNYCKTCGAFPIGPK
ncbi:MAG TPA: asparagine synthase-related protein [Candidatus Nitrosopolaris sp.]|nr:asparagine synthase-related protein [Candidatus Nitrosopolaris sp.]